ncbi:MAG: heparinase II/III family protein [Planctomycetaceae bacterium]|nr:heparinase II/III-family protein [Planctomycetaceae bacterium]
MRRGLLATRDELTALREKISQRPFDQIYQRLHKRCGLILETAPITQMQWQASWRGGQWCSAVLAARATQGRILDLAVAHHIDPNTAFRNRAIEELKNLASWGNWIDPCHNETGADLCTAEAAVAAVIGLDWLWEDMRDADRRRVLEAVSNNALGPYRGAVAQDAWWHTSYHNWNAVINGGMALAAMAVEDDDPLGAPVRELAMSGLKHFFDALGSQGGWDEGPDFWGYAMRYVLLLGEATARLKDDQRILHARGMTTTGEFPVYFSPNAHPVSFGDAWSMPLYGALYLLVKHHQCQPLLWWLDTYSSPHDVSASGYSTGAFAMLMRPAGAPTPETVPMEPVKAFTEAGLAAMADHWPRPSFYAAMRSGDLSANHAHHDINSLQLQVDGELLLIDPGSPSFTAEHFGTQRASLYHVQARAHNTLTVGRRDHQMDSQGSIAAWSSDAASRWVSCDAQGACGDNVRFLRQIVMLLDAKGAGQKLIVLDEVDNAVPEPVELFWHTLGELDLVEQSGAIIGAKAAVHFAIAASVPVEMDISTRGAFHGGRHTTLCASAGGVSRLHIASVFSRHKIAGKVSMAETDDGKIVIHAGKAAVTFGRIRGGLKLIEAKLG